MTTKTFMSAIAAILFTATVGVESPSVDNVPVSPPVAPKITYIDEPSAEQREMVTWAIERYLAAGLQLPDLEIVFPMDCGGNAGQYLVGQNRIELCHAKRKVVVHEFAHAWDDIAAVDRAAFMESRGLNVWYETPGISESGGEQLADVMTWGLMDVDTTWRSPEYAGQPVDAQPRYIAGVDGADVETLTNLFVQTTGVAPIVPLR